MTKRLFNPDLETGAIYDQKASLHWSWRKVTRGLLYIETGIAGMLIKGLLHFDWSLLYFNMKLLKCRSRSSQLRFGVVGMLIKVFFTLICRSGSSLLRYGVVEMSIKVFFTSIWSCWNVDQGLLYFDLEMLKCRSRSSLLWFGDVEMSIKGFSISIWRCWNVDLGLLYLELELLECWSRSSLLWSGDVEMSIKVFSTSIWNAEMLI